MKKVPLLLIYGRIVIGVFLFVLSFYHIQHYPTIAVALLAIGFLSDIFDGIIARRLNIPSQKLRRLDSTADQVFWCFVAASLYVECPSFFYDNYIKLIILISVEALTYAVSFVKFRKEVATHAISSKLWVITLFATLVQVMFTCSSGTLFQICFYAGVITRLEIILILLLLKTWTNDVPSVFHAARLRQGKAIKRHKLFNG